MDTESRSCRWREIAWNGIGLEVPDHWHPAVILESYLLFEEEYRPAFEIRWQAVRGRFSAARVLRKLARADADTQLLPWQPPPGWLASLAGCQVHGFRWHQSGTGGQGLLVHNPETGRSILLRFHQAAGTPEPDRARLLHSLHEQRGAEQTWAVFDIRARLPDRIRLRGQRFLPGSFTIDFRLDHLDISLLRFRPAAELLRDRSLAAFGDQLADGVPLARTDGPLAATWQSDTSAGHRLLRRLQRKKAYQLLSLWRIPEKNVILGLRARGNRAISSDLVQAIRDRYTAL